MRTEEVRCMSCNMPLFSLLIKPEHEGNPEREYSSNCPSCGDFSFVKRAPFCRTTTIDPFILVDCDSDDKKIILKLEK